MGTYKQKRSRKPWDLKTIRLRMQDAMKAIEPVFLGEEGTDYEEAEMQRICKAAHAYSQIGSKLRKFIETDEILERIEALEAQTDKGK